jgi:hypothetical protein
MAKKDKYKLIEAQRREVLSYLLAEIAEAKRHDRQRAKDREYADQLLRGEHLGDVPKGEPAVVSTDVADAIESILPDLLEIFNGGDDPVSIKPQRVASRQAAQHQRDLIRYQLAHQLPWFKIQYTWIKDCLAYRNGDLQWGWDYSFRWEENDYERLTFKDLEAIAWDGGKLLKQGEPWIWRERDPISGQLVPKQVGWLNCRAKERVIIKNQPLIRNIMPGSFLMSPSAQTIEDAAFGAIRDYPTMYRVKQEGRALGYDLGAVKGGPLRSDDESAAGWAERQRDDPLSGAGEDELRGRVERWQCFFQWDVRGNDEVEPCMATIINDRLVSFGANPYGRIPVESISPMLDTHRHEGVSLIDKVKEFQHIKTALYRAVIKMIRYATGPQVLAERQSGVDLNTLLRGQPLSVVQVDPGKINTVKYLERPAMGGEVRWFAEWVEALKEQRVGVTRLNQGLEGKGLNDTARGMLSLMAKADKRIRLMARLVAELGYKPLFRALIKLNQEFIDRELVVALSDDAQEDTSFNPEDLGGDFDLVVNVGLGNSDKATTVQQGQQMLSILAGLNKTPGGQIMVTPQNIYQLVKTIFDAMGWQSSLFINDPDKELAHAGPGAAAAGTPGAIAPNHGAGAAGFGPARLGGVGGVPGGLPPEAASGAAGEAQAA